MTENQAGSHKARLDDLLVTRGFFASRSRARDAVLRGTVLVDGRPQTKPGSRVAKDAALAVDDPARAYVSRAALKLVAAFDRFGLDPAGAVALDIGASTGGFTQVLLERGAQHVYAVDVGHGQLDADLAADPRVTNLEGLNARDLAPSHLDGRSVQFIVSDVSFISLKLALPAALDLAGEGAGAAF
ncbi:MAG: TlyA family RNA methyltransferase, partial [Nitratireductor sp.]